MATEVHLRVKRTCFQIDSPLVFLSEICLFATILVTDPEILQVDSNVGNNQRRVAAKTPELVEVNLMLNNGKTALYLGVCVY